MKLFFYQKKKESLDEDECINLTLRWDCQRNIASDGEVELVCSFLRVEATKSKMIIAN